MKKKITLVLAVALIVLTSCMLLIGCTPSKPSDYMLKWNDSKNKSITIISYLDYVQVETSEGVFEKKDDIFDEILDNINNLKNKLTIKTTIK